MRNIINIIIIIAVGIGIFDYFSKEDENSQQVKFAKLGSCPQMTVGEMAEGFMGSPSWSSGEAEDGGTFVNLKGDIMFAEKEVNALIQFVFNDDDTFKFNALEFNGVPQNTFVANALLEKMCKK